MQRPAEFSSLAAALAYLLLYALGALDDKTLMLALTMVIGALPAAVTSIVTMLHKPKPPPSAGQ